MRIENTDGWERSSDPYMRKAAYYADIARNLKAEVEMANKNAQVFNLQNQRLATLLDEKEAKNEKLRAVVDAAKAVTEYGEVAWMGINIPFKNFNRLKSALAALEDSDE